MQLSITYLTKDGKPAFPRSGFTALHWGQNDTINLDKYKFFVKTNCLVSLALVFLLFLSSFSWNASLQSQVNSPINGLSTYNHFQRQEIFSSLV